MKSVLIVVVIAVLALGAAFAFGKHKELVPNPQDLVDARVAKEQADNAKKAKEMQTAGLLPSPAPAVPAAVTAGAIHAVMSVEGRGDVQIELYPKAAPQTVHHFVDLIKSGFYNGIKVHRVVPSFVVQAGDPASKKYTAQQFVEKDDHSGGTHGLGSGGSGHTIPFEANPLTNEPGSLAMALSGPKTATGDSQFFINLVQNPALNGDYCVFGRVTQGMDVVAKIQRGDTITKIAVQ